MHAPVSGVRWLARAFASCSSPAPCAPIAGGVNALEPSGLWDFIWLHGERRLSKGVLPANAVPICHVQGLGYHCLALQHVKPLLCSGACAASVRCAVRNDRCHALPQMDFTHPCAGHDGCGCGDGKGHCAQGNGQLQTYKGRLKKLRWVRGPIATGFPIRTRWDAHGL